VSYGRNDERWTDERLKKEEKTKVRGEKENRNREEI